MRRSSRIRCKSGGESNEVQQENEEEREVAEGGGVGREDRSQMSPVTAEQPVSGSGNNDGDASKLHEDLGGLELIYSSKRRDSLLIKEMGIDIPLSDDDEDNEEREELELGFELESGIDKRARGEKESDYDKEGKEKKHEAMEEDEKSEGEEEESDEDAFDEAYVVMEFEDVPPDYGDSNFGKDYRILGIETDKPILRLGNDVFEGRYEDSCGTDMIFEDRKQHLRTNNTSGFQKEEQQDNWCYTGKSFKRLIFSKIHLFGNVEDEEQMQEEEINAAAQEAEEREEEVEDGIQR
eukprot:Nk52_evm21s16 gene=Nk52_evmTU21s16